MSIFQRIRDGELSKDSFLKTLANYEVQRIELQRREQFLGKDLFKSKMYDIDMSIKLTQIFIEKFEDLTKDSKLDADS